MWHGTPRRRQRTKESYKAWESVVQVAHACSNDGKRASRATVLLYVAEKVLLSCCSVDERT